MHDGGWWSIWGQLRAFPERVGQGRAGVAASRTVREAQNTNSRPPEGTHSITGAGDRTHNKSGIGATEWQIQCPVTERVRQTRLPTAEGRTSDSPVVRRTRIPRAWWRAQNSHARPPEEGWCVLGKAARKACPKIHEFGDNGSRGACAIPTKQCDMKRPQKQPSNARSGQ